MSRPLAVLLLAAAAGCSAASADPSTQPPPVDPDEPPSRPPGTTRMRMQAHFDELREIERAILRGDLEAARERAITIAFDRPESELPAWAPYILRMRIAASSLSRAESLADACLGEARLARECAHCHVASGAMPTFVVPAAPPDVPTVSARMARHQWAADRLWEGLVGLSDEAWRDGTAVLATTPLQGHDLSADPEQRARLTRYARTLQRSARRAAGARSIEARSAMYGELLAVCSGCHARLESDW